MSVVDIASSKITLTKYVISVAKQKDCNYKYTTRKKIKFFCFCFDFIIITLLLNFSSSEVRYFASITLIIECMDSNYKKLKNKKINAWIRKMLLSYNNGVSEISLSA